MKPEDSKAARPLKQALPELYVAGGMTKDGTLYDIIGPPAQAPAAPEQPGPDQKIKPPPPAAPGQKT
jgi:hypothetical protein